MRFNAWCHDEFSSEREGYVMNGISLAALLGAASWFGSKLREDDRDEDDRARDDAPLPAKSAGETNPRDNEFLWPSGPMFQ
jgi:hypothetical protein